VIFVDSNIPMYLIGAEHPRKVDAQRWLERLALEHERLVTDAEVLQEILHRFRAIDRADAIQPAFDVVSGLVDEVFPIDHEAVADARDELLARWGLSARDAVHIAVMRQHGVSRILSFDRGFDAVPDITRLGE
jgi:uncharacterized protein